MPGRGPTARRRSRRRWSRERRRRFLHRGLPTGCVLGLVAVGWPALALTGSDARRPAVTPLQPALSSSPVPTLEPVAVAEVVTAAPPVLRELPVTEVAAATTPLEPPAAVERPEGQTGGGRVASSRAEPVTATPVRWRGSKAVGQPFGGRLVNAVQLPGEGRDFVTWDSPKKRSPSRGWRRFGTDRLIRVVLKVAAEYRAAHPDAPRMVVGDLSRPNGGPFGPRYGGLGHRSHQNGLDVDVFYPRRDRVERPPSRVADIDYPLAQDLVQRFTQAGAEYVFVGPHTGLVGRKGVVMKLVHHDDHLHVRIRRG